MKIYCCLEHTGEALDLVIDEYEQAPFLTELNLGENCEFVCKFCGKLALYVVENEYSATK